MIPTATQMAALANRPFPTTLMFDVTNLCNMQCIHCPQPSIQAAEGFSPKFMPLQHFYAAVRELQSVEHPCFLRFTGDGEPMLHSHLLEMLVSAKSQTTCSVNLTTNASRLSSSIIPELLRANVDMIDISLDALSKDTYERVRQGGNFDRVLSNVYELLDLRQRTHSKTKVLVSFVVQQENAHEADAFQTYWRERADFVVLRRLHSSKGMVSVKEVVNANQVGADKRHPCPHPWKRLTLNFAGEIKYCPIDWGTGSTIGNIQTESLRDCWASLSAVREQHCSGEFDGQGICGPCVDWASTSWGQGYERIVDKLIYQYPALYPHLPLLENSP
jgi:sulfatase maturation enzyme AslB (radical SAM superfamily)